MKNITDIGLLVLRVGISLLMMVHGYGKMQTWLAGGEIQFIQFLGLSTTVSLFLAVIGEFIAPLFIALGFFTRYAASLAAFTMGVAAFYVHAGDNLADKEIALLYFIGFVSILLLGAGKYSLEAVWASHKGKSK